MLEDLLSERHRRRRERQQKLWLAAMVLAAALPVIGVLWIFFRSAAFRIRSVSIRGNAEIPAADIQNLLTGSILRDHGFLKSLLGPDSLLAWPSGRLPASDTNLIPQLADLSIAKSFWNKSVTVTVAERQPFAIWCLMPPAEVPTAALSIMGQQCFWFDGQGTVFQKTFDVEGGPYFAIHDYSRSSLGLNEKILPEQFVPNLASILDVLKQSGISVKEIALRDFALEEIDVSTYNGPDLYFSLRFSASDDLAVLENLMARPDFKTLQYVDFRVANRAYYK